MPLIAFMGISYVMREDGHIHMDIVVGQLQGRALYIAEMITTIAVFLLMLWGAWEHFSRSFDFSASLRSRDSSIDIGLPNWPTGHGVHVGGTVCVPAAGSTDHFCGRDDHLFCLQPLWQ